MVVEQKEIKDEMLGIILIRKDTRNKQIVLRNKDDGKVVISIPITASFNDAFRLLEKHRETLKERQEVKQEKVYIDEDSPPATFCFEVKIVRSERTNIHSLLRQRLLTITLPQATNVKSPDVQAVLRKHYEYFMRHEAKRLLPKWLMKLATQNGFTVKDVKVNSSQGRWGSCSNRKSINLSLYLMLLPEYLIEYVLLHELCHTVEMNHSQFFWEKLESISEGKAKQLSLELKKYSTW